MNQPENNDNGEMQIQYEEEYPDRPNELESYVALVST